MDTIAFFVNMDKALISDIQLKQISVNVAKQ